MKWILSQEKLYFHICLPPSFKGACSNRKEFAPLGSKAFPVRVFLLEVAPLGSKVFPVRVELFSEGIHSLCWKAGQEVIKVVSLVNNG